MFHVYYNAETKVATIAPFERQHYGRSIGTVNQMPAKPAFVVTALLRAAQIFDTGITIQVLTVPDARSPE